MYVISEVFIEVSDITYTYYPPEKNSLAKMLNYIIVNFTGDGAEYYGFNTKEDAFKFVMDEFDSEKDEKRICYSESGHFGVVETPEGLRIVDKRSRQHSKKKKCLRPLFEDDKIDTIEFAHGSTKEKLHSLCIDQDPPYLQKENKSDDSRPICSDDVKDDELSEYPKLKWLSPDYVGDAPKTFSEFREYLYKGHIVCPDGIDAAFCLIPYVKNNFGYIIRKEDNERYVLDNYITSFDRYMQECIWIHSVDNLEVDSFKNGDVFIGVRSDERVDISSLRDSLMKIQMIRESDKPVFMKHKFYEPISLFVD